MATQPTTDTGLAAALAERRPARSSRPTIPTTTRRAASGTG